MEAEEAPNILLSRSKNSDSRLQVQLHPLVILTVSDHITRHILRQQPGPVVGAILGSQNGRDITMEHAFECKVAQSDSSDEVLVDIAWFQDRLQEYKDVHKAPALDFVGWFTLAPPSGPQQDHLPIHHQLLHGYNESALLLTFHPSSVADGSSKGGKLPLAIYETVYEAVADADDDKHMQSSGEAGPQLSLRFQELPYTIETGEAEMIGVDFIARGGANASVSNEIASSASGPQTDKAKGKGKGKATESVDPQTQANGSDTPVAARNILSPEDEELIASLTAKANATRMLQQRIHLIKSYLTSLPPCYLNTPPADDSTGSPAQITPDTRISYPILRQISSLLARLPLLNPTEPQAQSSEQQNGSAAAPTTMPTHKLEQQTQQTDTHLLSLLSSLGSTLQTAASLGKKFAAYETGRHSNMSLSQRRMMGQIQEQGPMPYGFDQGGFDEGMGGRRRGNGPAPGRGGRGPPGGFSADTMMESRNKLDDQLDDDDDDDDDGDEMLQQEEWEEMDENS